jgi:CcmD family protein
MPSIVRRVASVVLIVLCSGALALAAAQDQAKEFKRLDQLPPMEQIPAARLLIAAYVVVIVVLFLYLLSVARRLNTVQREVERLEADVKRTARP